MKKIARELVRRKNEDKDGSLVAVWTKEDDSEEWSPYFHLLSDHTYDARTEFCGESALLVVRNVDLDLVTSCVPSQEERNGGTRTITIETDDPGTLTYEFQSDVRLKRRTSQEMSSWGIQYPALCFEHWVNTDDVVHPTSNTQDRILSELSEMGIELAANLEFVGNILVAITDRRAIVDKNEVSEQILDKRRNNSDSLSDDEWLELYDDWKVELFDLTLEETDLTLRWEEFGETLYEVPLDTSSQNSISREDAIEAISKDWKTGGIRITSQGSIARYSSPSPPVTGASDLVLELTYQGVVVDRYSQPLIRSIGFSVNTFDSGAQPTENEPPKLFKKSDHLVGDREWDYTVTPAPEESQQSWVVDGQDDVNEVMAELFSRFNGTVKICEPYLRPNRISEFTQNTESGSDLWIVVGHDSGHMNNMREDLKQNIREADDQDIELRVLWIPGGHGSNSPLHDRFILSAEGGLTIGTSFNSFDSNISYVSQTPQADAIDLETNFDRWWQDRMFRERHDVEEIRA